MTRMKNVYPMLFSTPMVQAIMNDTKTVTRRTKGLEKVNTDPDNFEFQNVSFSDNDDELYWFKKLGSNQNQNDTFFLENKYKRGDVFWVRETHAESVSFDMYFYRADVCSPEHDKPTFGWKPSIFMPKKACRNFLELVSIDVQRLRQIDEESARKEGVLQIPDTEFLGYKVFKNYKNPDNPKGNDFGFLSAINSFCSLWKNINGVESWNIKNPFVWVYTFKRVERPEGFI